jgi:hypothetical protein
MKRFSSIFAVFAILSWAAAALAHEGHHVPGEKTITKTISGEVVDMGCWLGHAARGKEHISCATKCLNQGMPIGLLTSNGTLYLVTLDHDNADPYVGLKDLAGKDVSITGELLSRSGMKAIEASKVQLASN